MTRFNRKLVLENKTRVADGAGGYTASWIELGVHWGALEPAAGRFERGDEAARSAARYRIRLRAVPQTSISRPLPGQRFRDGARYFDIRSVQDSGDARQLICQVVEEVAT